MVMICCCCVAMLQKMRMVDNSKVLFLSRGCENVSFIVLRPTAVPAGTAEHVLAMRILSVCLGCPCFHFCDE